MKIQLNSEFSRSEVALIIFIVLNYFNVLSLFIIVVCISDPEVAAPGELTSAVQAMIIGISVGVGGIIIIIVAVIVILWCIKSKRREKERFERTASIRSSLSNMAKLNGSLRGTKSSASVLSERSSRRRLGDVDDSVDSSYGKTSQISVINNGINRNGHGIGIDRNEHNTGIERNEHSIGVSRNEQNTGISRNEHNIGINRNERNVISNDGEDQNQETAPQRRDNLRPVHSLKPGRPIIGSKVQTTARITDRNGEVVDRNRETGRKKNEAKRPQYSKDINEDNAKTEQDDCVYSSTEDSDEKESFVSDSTFDRDDDDDDENGEGGMQGAGHDNDASNMQCHFNRSIEHLLEKPKVESDQTDFTDTTVSSYTQVSKPAAKNMFPQRITLRGDLPPPPPDPRTLHFPPQVEKQVIKPPLHPKPLPKARSVASRSQGHLSPAPSDSWSRPYENQGYLPDSPMDTRQSRQEVYENQFNVPSDSQPNEMITAPALDSHYLYNNTPEPEVVGPVFNPVRRSSSPIYGNIREFNQRSNSGAVYDPAYDGRSIVSSQGFPPYDPVYTENPSDYSNSTSRYEPVVYSQAEKNLYGVNQQPDDDIMPRRLDKHKLGRSREQLDVPLHAMTPHRSTNLQESIKSDQSLVPSVESDVDYMPRQFGNRALSRSREQLDAPSHAAPYRPSNTQRLALPEHSSVPSIESDIDYMPRQQGSRTLSRSRDQLDTPSHTPAYRPANSHDLAQSEHSSIPSVESDIDYMPRQSHQRSDKRFLDSVPQRTPHESLSSYDSRYSTASSPPPYSPGPDPQFARSYERLDLRRGSRDLLHEQPPPYSPGGEEILPRHHGGNRDILYLPRGIRTNIESHETEI